MHTSNPSMRTEFREASTPCADVALRAYVEYLVPKVNAARVAFGLTSVPTFAEYNMIVRSGGRLP